MCVCVCVCVCVCLITKYCTDLLKYFLFPSQIHPVISRLCASIQGTSPERLADCLGLDTSKVKRLGLCQHSEAANLF